MHKITKALLRILDGAPYSSHRRANQAGQSLVELAFITPLLAIMIVGIVEIGWYANHFLVLLEVTRVGARSGTVLTGDLSPLQWNELASTHPIVYRDGYGKSASDVPQQARDYRDCDQSATFQGFYNFIACVMLDSLAPLTLQGNVQEGGSIGYRFSNSPALNPVDVVKIVKDRYGNIQSTLTYPDDIVISVFSAQAINNANPTSLNPAPNQTTDARQYALYNSLYSRTYNFGGTYPAGSQVIIVGRYPKRANECNVYDKNGVRVVDTSTDPFDYIANNARNSTLIKGRSRYIELDGRDPISEAAAAVEEVTFDEFADDPSEMQIGFSWTAQHKRVKNSPIAIANGGTAVCWGSEWDNADVASLLNLPEFVAGDTVGVKPWNQQRAALTSQGLVLVEMYWQHSILLDFPFIAPIVAMFGDTNNIVISSWAAFPVPAAEPNIVYGLP